jgi:hypothetical protein
MQSRMTCEKSPAVILWIYYKCHWCYWSLNRKKGVIAACPVCSAEILQVPLATDEVYAPEKKYDGIVMMSNRRFPLRYTINYKFVRRARNLNFLK